MQEVDPSLLQPLMLLLLQPLNGVQVGAAGCTAGASAAACELPLLLLSKGRHFSYVQPHIYL